MGRFSIVYETARAVSVSAFLPEQWRTAHPDTVSSVLEVDQTRAMPYAFNHAQLVLDEVEVVEGGVGVRGIWRVVVEGGDGAKEVEGEVEGAVESARVRISSTDFGGGSALGGESKLT